MKVWVLSFYCPSFDLAPNNGGVFSSFEKAKDALLSIKKSCDSDLRFEWKNFGVDGENLYTNCVESEQETIYSWQVAYDGGEGEAVIICFEVDKFD